MGPLRYSPFGELVEMSGPSPMFGFTGEQQDFDNNLVYLRARYYNPALGRFLTPDSLIPDITNGQALNAYAYVYNDPINLVDPTGNIPDVGSAIVSVAKYMPAHKRAQLVAESTAGLTFLNWWYAKPDDCSSRSGSPAFITDLTGSINRNVANPAGQLALAAWTYPAQKVAARVDVYGRWPTSTSMGRMSVDKFSHSYHNMDVTNMKLLDHAGSSTYRNGSGQMSRVLRMNDGRKVVIHNAETRTTVGPGGLVSSILLSGFIDAAFQLYGDWASGLCLSPNQYFWRANVALWLGLATGMVGAAVVVAAIAAGAPALAAGLVGFTVTSLIGYGLHRTGVKDNLIKKVSDGAGRY